MPPKNTLKQAIQQTQDNLASLLEQKTTSTKAPNATPARSYISSDATNENEDSFQNPFQRVNTTFRPAWRTQDAAVQQSKVITTNIQPPSNALGAAVSPATTSNVSAGVPDMAVSIQVPAGSQVHIAWSFSGALSANTLSATFVLVRDNVRIGQPLYGASAVANAKFSVSQSFIDSPSAGLHSYAVYWATSGGTLTADAKSRQITALNLKPQ